ncbi:Fur family transcriptional regulator [Chloroflexota bacterium]
MSQHEESEAIARHDLPGRRITGQRVLLLDLISQADRHLGADELYRHAKEKGANISLSTVYRNLRLFKKLNLIDERHFVEEHHHYETKDSAEHHHLTCLRCGQVMEFQSPLIQRMRQAVGHDRNFEITGAEVHMAGYCSRCRRQRK